MNRALLDFAGLRRKGGHRSTFVDVNLVTPKPPPFSQRLLWICRVTLVEFGLQLSATASMGLHSLAKGAALMTCMAINIILMSILREICGLKFDKKTDWNLTFGTQGRLSTYMSSRHHGILRI
jgi:hypothetical protein